MPAVNARKVSCVRCHRGWNEYTGADYAPAALTCPFCGAAQHNRLTCTACGTRLLRASVDGMCGFCSPLGMDSAPLMPEDRFDGYDAFRGAA